MNITERINDFREAARHVWNTHFRHEAEQNQDWDLRDAFSEVYVALFNSIVRVALPDSAPSIPHLWDPERNVLPEYRVTGQADRLPLMINRDKPASGNWDHQTKYVESSAVDLRLVALFDWDNVGFREFRYFRVRIVLSDNPDLVDRDALAEVGHCTIEYVEKQETPTST